MVTVLRSAVSRVLRQGWPVLLVFVVGISLTFILAGRAADAERQIVKSRFEQEARSRILLVEELIQGQLRELDAMRRFITLDGELTRDDFQTLTRLSDRINMTVAWTENVPASHMSGYRERMDYYYDGQFKLRLPSSVEALSSGDIRRHFPITFQKTSVPGVNLVGVDTSYLPTRVLSYDQAMSTGGAVMVGGIRTLDAPGNQSGILVVAPVFNQGTGVDITERHFGNLRGFLVMGLRLSDLAELVSSAHDETDGVQLIFEEFVSSGTGARTTEFASQAGHSRYSFRRDLELADSSVSVLAVPSNDAEWQPRATAALVIVVGIAASSLAAAYLALVVFRRSQAEAIVERRTEELRSTLEALSASEARWQFALDGSGDGVWDWDARRDVVFYSDGWKSMLGYESDEIGTTPSEWSERVHPEDVANRQQALLAHFRGETDYYENVHRLRCKDGEYKWFLDRGKVVEWSAPGKPARVIGTHADITHVKQTELELREANAFLSGLLSSAEDVAIITADTAGMITLFNQGAEKLLGYSAEEVVRKATTMLFHDSDEVAEWGRAFSEKLGRPVQGFEVFRVGIEEGFHHSERWTLICKNGERRQVQLTLCRMRDAVGDNLGYLGIAVDMTDYLRAVDALEENSHLLQDLTANVPGAIYQFLETVDGQRRFPYISDGVLQIFEMSPEDASESSDAAMTRIHSSDIGNVETTISRSRDKLIPWICEFRVCLPRQGERWLRGEATPRRRSDGGTLWHGYISDITEVKKLEFQLREQATVDPLTGVFNRRHLDDHWQREMARFRRSGLAFAMIMLDIDHFKRINDTHGHDVGDDVLVRLSRLLRHEVRSTDVVYRLGGEEFLVLCEDTDQEGARYLAEQLREQLNQQSLPVQESLTASFGVVEVALDEPMSQAFKRLDELLYLAKSNGRDQVASAPVEPVS